MPKSKAAYTGDTISAYPDPDDFKKQNQDNGKPKLDPASQSSKGVKFYLLKALNIAVAIMFVFVIILISFAAFAITNT